MRHGRCYMVNGARGRRFDASHKRHPVTESSYINSLANHLYRSTVKTLPATLPEPWTMARGPRSKHMGPWSTDLGPQVVNRASKFKLRGSRLVDAEPGLLGLVAGSGSIWSEGWGVCWGGCLRLGPGRVMDGWKQRRLILFEPAANSNPAPLTI